MRVFRAAGLAALLSLPAIAGAQTTDDLRWPDDGHYPGYPQEPDPRTVHFAVEGGVTHDDNIFRFSDSTAVPAGVSKSDTIYRVGARLRANIPVSQQRIVVDARVDNYTFDNNSRLDHVNYRAGAAWNWRMTRCSASIGSSAIRLGV